MKEENRTKDESTHQEKRAEVKLSPENTIREEKKPNNLDKVTNNLSMMRIKREPTEDDEEKDHSCEQEIPKGENSNSDNDKGGNPSTRDEELSSEISAACDELNKLKIENTDEPQSELQTRGPHGGTGKENVFRHKAYNGFMHEDYSVQKLGGKRGIEDSESADPYYKYYRPVDNNQFSQNELNFNTYSNKYPDYPDCGSEYRSQSRDMTNGGKLVVKSPSVDQSQPEFVANDDMVDNLLNGGCHMSAPQSYQAPPSVYTTCAGPAMMHQSHNIQQPGYPMIPQQCLGRIQNTPINNRMTEQMNFPHQNQTQMVDLTRLNFKQANRPRNDPSESETESEKSPFSEQSYSPGSSKSINSPPPSNMSGDSGIVGDLTVNSPSSNLSPPHETGTVHSSGYQWDDASSKSAHSPHTQIQASPMMHPVPSPIQPSQPSPMMHPVPSPQQIMTAPSPQQMITTPSPSHSMGAPSPQQIMTAPSPQQIMTAPSPQQIMTASSPQQMMSTPSPQQLMTVPSPQQMMSTTSPQQLMTAPSPQQIVTAPSPPQQTMPAAEHGKENFEHNYVEENLERLSEVLEVIGSDLAEQNHLRKVENKNISQPVMGSASNMPKMPVNNQFQPPMYMSQPPHMNINQGPTRNVQPPTKMAMPNKPTNQNLPQQAVKPNVMSRVATVQPQMQSQPVVIMSQANPVNTTAPASIPLSTPLMTQNHMPIIMMPPTTMTTQPVVTGAGQTSTIIIVAPPNQPIQNPPKSKPIRKILPKLLPADSKAGNNNNSTAAPPKVSPTTGNINDKRPMTQPVRTQNGPNKGVPNGQVQQRQHLLNLARRTVANISREQLQYTDKEGDTYLHIAVCRTDSSMVQALLERLKREKLDNMIDMENKKRQTPLYLAVVDNQPQMVNMFIRCGANPSAMAQVKSTDGKSMEVKAPIHVASSNGESYKATLLELLKATDINLNIVNSEGHTALHCAILNHRRQNAKGEQVNSLPIIELLIQKGVEPNSQDKKSGKTPLMYAIEQQDPVLVERMLCLFDPGKLRNIIKSQTFDGSSCLKIAEGHKSSYQPEMWQRLYNMLNAASNGDPPRLMPMNGVRN